MKDRENHTIKRGYFLICEGSLSSKEPYLKFITLDDEILKIFKVFYRKQSLQQDSFNNPTRIKSTKIICLVNEKTEKSRMETIINFSAKRRSYQSEFAFL